MYSGISIGGVKYLLEYFGGRIRSYMLSFVGRDCLGVSGGIIGSIWSYISKAYLGSSAQLYSSAETPPAPPPPL
jgi:hypothetical protein